MFTRLSIPILSLCILPLLLSSACASTEQRVLSGAAIGGGLGTVIGHRKGHNSKSRIVGASTGAVVGGLIGYFFNDNAKGNSTKTAKSQKPTKVTSPSAPFLTRPKVSMYWEPDTIEGNKYIERHRVWILKSSPTWTK